MLKNSCQTHCRGDGCVLVELRDLLNRRLAIGRIQIACTFFSDCCSSCSCLVIFSVFLVIVLRQILGCFFMFCSSSCCFDVLGR